MQNVYVGFKLTFFVMPEHQGRNHEALTVRPSETRHLPSSEGVGNLALNVQGRAQELTCQRRRIGGCGAVNEHAFDA